jgi:hypothetical protein
MTQERIKYFEDLLEKPMAEPHRAWIEELLEEVKGKAGQSRASKKIDGMKPDFKGDYYTPQIVK